jgi:hypothetical protein
MDHLSPWVFAIVYGGFGLMAIGIVVLASRYAAARWGHVLRRPPGSAPVSVRVAGGLGLLPFGAAMLWWGVFGPGSTGPQAMDAVVQRTTLVVSGLLAVAGFLPPLLPGPSGRAPRLAWLALWVGCTTAVMQAPTHVLLADGGHPNRAILLIGLLTVAGSSTYGLLLLRRHPAHDRLRPV